jgi:ATP-binding cassette subfamily B (MDR/TAP) protein 1
MGASLAQRVRLMLYRSILHQEVGFFDRDENTSGAIVSRLSTDSADVRGATGDVLGLVIQNIVTLIAGYTIAFMTSWRMALVITGTLPLLVLGSIIEMQSYTGA